jgi:hypothetical protein
MRERDRDDPARISTGRWYVGERCAAGCRVVALDGEGVQKLAPRTRDPLWSFSWGRSGTSARELAWAVLFDCTHDRRLADDWCADLTANVISLLPRDAFCLSSRDVLAWLHGERPSPEQPHPPTAWIDSAATLEAERLIEAVRPLWAVRR